MQELLLTTLPPTTNHAHVHTRAGFTFLSARTKDFRQEVWAEAKRQRITILEGWLKYEVRISFGKFKNGKWKSGDASNRIKQLEDSLNGIAWVDDEQVIESHIYREFSEEPFCKISISTIDHGTNGNVRESLPGAPTTAKRIRGTDV